MSEQRLWAPWRLDYIAGNEPESEAPEPQSWLTGADRECFLCRAAAEYPEPRKVDQQLLVVSRQTQTVTVLNRFPYNTGHLLIAPRRHIADLSDANREEHIETAQQMCRVTSIYRELIRAEGFNIGLNLGRVAGAGVPGHLHWHVVPRWSGDNNFMPVHGATRVIPQSLDSMWSMLVAALAESEGIVEVTDR